MPDLPLIPDKLYFKIGEVCDLTGLKQHVLRYWESEFRILAPQRANSRQRLYRRVDVENILRIKRLLKEEGFTISGAKKALAEEQRAAKTGAADKVKAPPPEAATLPADTSAPATTEGRTAPAGEQAKARVSLKQIKAELADLKKILDA